MFSSQTAVNGMLTSHCNNLSTHYYLTYHTCSTRDFVTAKPRNSIFALLQCLQEKAEAIELPIVPRRALKRKARNCFDIDLDWAASDKGSSHTSLSSTTAVQI